MSVDSEKEIAQLKKRFLELADKAYNQNMYTFTSFLGLSEQDAFWQMSKQISHVKYMLFGGTKNSERQMIRFGSPEELLYEEEFPIECIHIRPLIAKFADKLSHRDFLGALMNLGIDRSVLGDIHVLEKEGYLFCQKSIAPFVCENLDQIKHTHVKCEIAKGLEDYPHEEPEIVEFTASSDRADGVIAKIYGLSRTKSLELFQDRLIFINGRLSENNSQNLKAGDNVTVRGFGKFEYQGIKYETKKGKLCIEAKVFR